MNKININGLTQGCTAEQLNAIAWNILHRKGDVDMSGCNVTITPPSGMSPGMAGIIVKCASTQNGTVNISGATEIDDDVWTMIKKYGCPTIFTNLIKQYGLDANILLSAWGKYPSIYNVLNGKGYMNMPDGNCYWNTRDIPTSDIVAEIKINPTASLSSWPMIFGERVSSTTDAFDCYINNGSTAIGSFLAGSMSDNVASFTYGSDIVIKMTSSSITVNGTAKAMGSGTIGSSATTLAIVATGKNGGGQWEGKLHYARYFHGNTIWRYWIPCANNKLIDLVTGEELTNVGSGTATLITE